MVSMGRFCGLVSVFVVHAVSLQDWHDPVFQHPAGWHSSSDIIRIRSRVSAGDEPWQSAALRLLNDTSLTSDYEPSAKTTVCRGTGGKECGGSMELERDSMAAYYLMLRWIASGGDAQWSEAAARIVDAWSSTLVNFTGHDQMLAAGIYGAHFAQAAELVAVADPEWKGKARAQKMFAEVFHPVCEWFCGGATQQVQRCDHGANGNWDASCMSGVASWAVFLDNRTMLETVANYYRNGRGNGRLTHYVYPSGQAQESGRDQAHTQDGLEHLLETALLYWKATGSCELLQLEDFRLEAGLEYTARYNLNLTVPFEPNCDVYNISCFQNISSKGRGQFAPLWEMASAVYPNSTFISQVTQQPGYSPEGFAPPIIHGGAHVGDGPPGQGTLTFFGMEPPNYTQVPAPRTWTSDTSP